jgi:hypothetical protein
MKGYAYLDIDANLVFKDYKYINEDNPFFWKDNAHLLVKWWKFDTEDLSSMRTMLTQFKDLEIKAHIVQPFLEALNFDMSVLKTNATPVKPR